MNPFQKAFPVFLFLLIAGCNRGGNILTGPPDPPVNHPPIAAAHVDNNEIIVGDSLQFYDDSTDPNGDDDIVKWEWDFTYDPEDGFQVDSEEREPVHVYEEEWTNEVQLRVTDLGGLSDLLDEPLIVITWHTNDFNLQEVFRIDIEFNAVDVEIQSDFAYVLSPEFGLDILYLSYYNIHTTGKFFSEHHPQWVEVEGNYAYLLSRHNSVLQIINIADPRNPELAGMLQLDGNSQNMVVRDGYIYISRGWEGILIVDVSNPVNPSIAGSIHLGTCAAGIGVYGDYAVILDNYESAFYILDISTPESAHVVRTVNTLVRFDLVELKNGYAYVATSQSDHLILYDIDPPELAHPITSAPHIGLNITDIELVENSIYVYLENGSLYSLTSDPSTPFSYISHVDSIPGFGIAADVSHVCVINKSNIWSISVDLSGSLHLMDAFQIDSYFDDVAISGNNLLIVSDGMSIYDISDPHFPYKVGKIEIKNLSTRVETDGQYAYVLTRTSRDHAANYLSIINIYTQEIVVNKTYLGSSWNFGDIIIQSGYAYICSFDNLQIWDIDPPADLNMVEEFLDLGGPASDVDLNNGFAYVTYGYWGYGGIEVFDVDSPESSQQLNRYSTQLPARALAISGEYIFVATQGSSESKMEAFKISGPGELEFIDSVTVEGYAERIVIDGHHAYIANFQGVQIFDISDPENMTSLVSYFTEGDCINLEVDGDYLYLADSEYGVRIIKLR